MKWGNTMERDKFAPSEDYLRMEREATSLRKDISTARGIISDGLQRYKKKMLHARNKKQVDDLSVFDVLNDYSSLRDIQDAYGYDCISAAEYDRLCSLWDAREMYIDENGRFSDRVSEMLQRALNGCGEVCWDALNGFDKMKQQREDDIERIMKENAENDYKRRHNNDGGFTL